MNLSMILVVFVFVFQFALAEEVGDLFVFCFEDDASTTARHEVHTNKSGKIVVYVQARIHVVVHDNEIKDNLITLQEDKVNWSRIVGETAKKVRAKKSKIRLNEQLADSLTYSISDEGLAKGAMIIYQLRNNDERFFDVIVEECEEKKDHYSIRLRIISPVSSPVALKIHLTQEPVMYGIHMNDADEVKKQLCVDAFGLDVLFIDTGSQHILNNWNKKMYFVKIPAVPNTLKDVKPKSRGQFSEDSLLRLAIGGEGKVQGKNGRYFYKLKQLFSTVEQTGFMVDGIIA